jgi:putative endonuclease
MPRWQQAAIGPRGVGACLNTLGEAAEQLAAAHRKTPSLRTLTRNYTCRLGEIDIVCVEGEVLVFVGVRQRRSERFGGAAWSITAQKRQRIISTSRHYLMRLGHLPACRFDVVLVCDAVQRIEWLRSAIEA